VSSVLADDAGRWLAAPAGSARDVRLRVALNHQTSASPPTGWARGECAVHLRPGRRRRRAHRLRPSGWHGVVPCAAQGRADGLRACWRRRSWRMTTRGSAVPPAHGRTGDKGNRANISVIAWHPALWDTLVEQVTEDAVHASSRTAGPAA
jgi:hypothetical protein